MSGRVVPTHLKRLHGNPGKQHLPAEPEGVGLLWKPPEWFDDEQRDQWHYAIEHAPPGLLTATDRENLVVWCAASVEHARASSELRKQGQTITNKQGNVIINPLLVVMNRQAEVMLRASGTLGFSPVSRAAIGRALGREGFGVPAGPGLRQIAGSALGKYLDEAPDKFDS